MNKEGHLCYSAVSDDEELVFSQSSDTSKAGHLVFAKNQGDWAQVTFAWGASLTDLDICAYWEGAPGYTFGYKQRNETPPSPYNIKWSGDQTGTGVSEWCQIWKSNWKSGSNVFRVHFNYFRSAPAGSVCTVIANQRGGETKILNDVPCGTRTGEAYKTDPGVEVEFDGNGKLQEVRIYTP